tara:strand:+ start:560 stop:820 length:261 start_codon:yes stop_codon:yes gene_type:complete
MSKKKIAAQELTPKELTSLQQLLSVLNQSKVMLADAVIAQQEALAAVMANKTGFAAIEAKLVKTYGEDVSVNVQTGAITYKEDGKN